MTDSYDDHTLVITTFNRPQHLYRLLSYVAQDLPVGRVRVVDGSLEPYRSDNARVVAAFADRMPVELDALEPGIDVLDHHRHAWACAETPFMTFCHDDNFVVPAAIREQVGFLRGHPDYANCCGMITCIRTMDDRTTAFVCDMDALEQDDPLDRLAHFLANHWNAEFGTWRSDSRRASGPTFDLYHLDEAIGEPLSIGISALHGKFHMLPLLSVIFCLHETNRGTDAAERKSSVVMPDFPRILTTVGDVISDYCRNHGIAPPADGRAYYLTPYLRFMAKWWHHFRAIAKVMRKRTAAALPEHEIDAMDARAEQAVLTKLLGLSAPEIAAIRTEQELANARSKPSTGELFVIQNDDVLVLDVPVPEDDPTEIMALPTATELPGAYRVLCEMMLSDDWHGRYKAFVAEVREDVLGPLAGDAAAQQLFDAAFLMALVRLVKPLHGAHPSRSDHLAQCLDPGLEVSAARTDLLSAADHIEVFNAPHFGDGGVPESWQPLTPIARRVFYSRPLPGTVELPFVQGEVRASNGVAFIPLSFVGAPAEYFNAGHQLWLCVEIERVRGKVQFSLYNNGTLDLLVPITETAPRRTLYFPIRDLATEYLIMRDITRVDGPGQCSISRMSWVALDRPLTHLRRRDAAHSAAA